MPHDAFFGIDPKHRGLLQGQHWSLCIGSGINNGIMPDWKGLTSRTLNRCLTEPLSPDQFDELSCRCGWGLDSWLQAGLNNLIQRGQTVLDFWKILEEELYGDLLRSASSHGVRDKLIVALSDPKKLKRSDVDDLSKFFEGVYSNTSLMSVVRWLLSIKDARFLPRAVLTFNADGLLDTILRIQEMRHFVVQRGKGDKPPMKFVRALRSAESSRGHTPVFHLHGCIVPNNGGITGTISSESRESLIFSEGSYGQLSSKVFTWQQTVFLSHAQSQRMLFVGLSMSDPNIRRWLSWCNANALDEHRSRKAMGAGNTNPPPRNAGEDCFLGRHVWVEQCPDDPQNASAMEFSLAHLGTRICWLKNWAELPVVLGNLIPS